MITQKPSITHIAGAFLACLGLLLQPSIAEARPTGEIGKDWGDPAGLACVSCHSQKNPGLYSQWNESQHGQNGVNCYDCHKADSSDKDAFKHQGQTISVLVTPKDCARCHEQQVKEFDRSHHSKGGDILESADNVLGLVLGGPAAVTLGCEQCHGSKIEIDDKGKPAGGWPNTGIGRLNPDGTKGACTACHARHGFSKAQARQPDACGKCHLGPDHPQLEVYNESKHGIIFHAKIDEMNLKSEKWVAGVDYSAAPTCATCHMSAAPDEPKTHDVGERLSWNLRAKISSKKNMVRLDNGQEYDVVEGQPLPKVGDKPEDPKANGGTVTEVLTWEDRRGKMLNVCKACHSPSYAEGHYKNLDEFVALYNDKFAKPVSAIMGELANNGHTTKTAFDDWIEWIWWEIWHHEGRRARTGAAMAGPDYAWWHGIYDVAKHTYMEFIPELKTVAGEDEANRLLDKYFRPIEGHDWYFEAIGDPTIRDNTLPSLGHVDKNNGTILFEGGTSVMTGTFQQQVEITLDDYPADDPVKVKIHAKVTRDSAAIDYNQVKVLVKIDSDEAYFRGTNNTPGWEATENNQIVIWNNPIPTNLKGKKVLFQVEVDSVRSPQRIEATIK
jgi:hydroxylamine dehydrogenase